MARKFEVGQSVWLRSGVVWDQFIEHEVVGIEGRSYLLKRAERGRVERVSFAKAERHFLTDREMGDRDWTHRHRHEIARLIERADPAVLKKVAEVMGYRPES